MISNIFLLALIDWKKEGYKRYDISFVGFVENTVITY
jgi:hypothetical protein